MANYFTLSKDGGGLILRAFSAGKFVGSLMVRTGLPGRQNFRTKAQEVRGQYEPVPEAVYQLGPLYFASGRHGDYSRLYPNIKSPIWVEIDPNRAIGFHLDAGVVGTAGCVGFATMADLKTFVGWYDLCGSFDALYVDWGLGTVKLPAANSQPETIGKIKLKINGKEQEGIRIGGKSYVWTALVGGVYDKPTDTVTIK